MFKKALFFSAMTTACLTASIPAAWAGKDHGKNQKSDHSERHYNDDDDHYWGDHNDGNNITVIIGGTDREYIREYIHRDYRRHCPPGLAKKHNGCMPPGQAKKRYQIGYPLPRDVIYYPVPDDFGLHAPRGYQYVQVDKDILLIGEATKKVIDAVTLLSAVGE